MIDDRGLCLLVIVFLLTLLVIALLPVLFLFIALLLVKNGRFDIIEEVGGKMEFGEFVERMRGEFLELRFREGRKFMYRPVRTVVFERREGGGSAINAGREGESWDENNLKLQLLHEIGHALSGHRTFKLDLERLKMEREAWEKAKILCEKYGEVCGVRYDEEFVEAEMDTYREWLHRRSLCRKCGLTRYQTEQGQYFCPWCDQKM